MSVATVRVVSPTGRGTVHELDGSTVVIGRRSPTFVPDVVLEPDPDRWVGRSHCTLDHDDGRWWATDGGSVNGTLLRREGRTTRLAERTRLQHGDTLLVLGDADEDGTPLFWELVLADPYETQSGPEPAQVDGETSPACAEPGASLRYDWVAARLHRREGDVEQPLEELRPMAHQLVRYMAARADSHDAVACSHDELIAALWGDPAEGSAERSYTRTDLAGVVRDVRRVIEVDPSNPALLQTVTGFGYRLVVHHEI